MEKSNIKEIKWYCPVCGNDLSEYARSRAMESDTVYDTGFVLYTTICPCCGVQFGLDDTGTIDTYDEDKKFYKTWRNQWIIDGMKWWAEQNGEADKRRPKSWNPKEQLKNVPEEFK